MSDRSFSLAPLLIAGAGAILGSVITHLTWRSRHVQQSERLLQAARFAAEKHRDQRRKNPHKHPYINHPVRVAHRLASAGVSDIDTLIAALLHDTVEDTDTTLEEISDIFGNHVASIVNEVTDDKSLPGKERKQMQIVHAPHSSPQAKLVKLGDKLDNLSDLLVTIPVGWSGERVAEYFNWSSKVVHGLRSTNKSLEDDLDSVFLRSNEAVQLAALPTS